MAALDKSNGYEAIAPIFIASRGSTAGGVGASVVAGWSATLPAQGAVLDLGCGTGIPISKTLIDRGFHVYGVDASPAMVAAFRRNFPAHPVQCAAAQDSDFFERTFDAIVAWGLLFLLDEPTQRNLIAKVAAALAPAGRLLFTSPRECTSWSDVMTDRPSLSLGYEAYVAAMKAQSLSLAGTLTDAGGNFYYDACKL